MASYLRRKNSFQCTSIEIRPHTTPPRGHMPTGDLHSRVEDHLSHMLQQISYGGKAASRLQGLQDLQQFLLARNNEHYFNALQQGADRILAWQLTQHLNTEPKDTETIDRILNCLELLWTQCPADRLQQSANDLIDVLPWLVHSWQCFLENDDDSSIVERVQSIFRIWSKLKDSHIKTKLIRSGVVTCIEREASRCIHNDKRGISTLSLVKDFTFRASRSEKEYLYTALKDVILQHCQSDHPCMVEAMTATLWNCAAEHAIGKSMAEDRAIWKMLDRLRTRWQDNGIAIMRNWSSIIGTIVAVAVSDGNDSSFRAESMIQEQSWMVPSLLDILKKESDSDLRRRCTRTIRCLVSCSWGRQFMVEHADSTVITHVLTSLATNRCNDSDTRVQACQAIRSMLIISQGGLDIKIAESLVPILEERDVEPKLAVSVLHVLAILVAKRKWKPEMASLSGIFLPRISSVLNLHVDEITCHHVVANFLREMVRMEDYSIQDYSSASQKMLLDCITSLLEPLGPDFEDSRKFAVEIVTTLASNQVTKKVLAGHDRLLTALVNFCLIANGSLKTNVKAIILALVPEL